MAARFRFVLALLVLGVLYSSTAHAQYVDPDDHMRFEGSLDSDEFMVLYRARAIVVPGFILGLWFDEHATHWSGDQKNLSHGVEIVWRKNRELELSLGVDYADLTMPSAFWKESGDEPAKADWTEIDLKILSFVLSSYWFWDVQDWFSPFLGGGIGLGIVMGEGITKYKPREDSDCRNSLGGEGAFSPPSCFQANGEPDPNQINFDEPDVEDGIWPVVPMVNITVGARFNIGKHAVLKIETGINTYAFAGMSLGAQW